MKVIHLLEESQKCQTIVSKILSIRVEEVEVKVQSVSNVLIRN